MESRIAPSATMDEFVAVAVSHNLTLDDLYRTPPFGSWRRHHGVQLWALWSLRKAPPEGVDPTDYVRDASSCAKQLLNPDLRRSQSPLRSKVASNPAFYTALSTQYPSVDPILLLWRVWVENTKTSLAPNFIWAPILTGSTSYTAMASRHGIRGDCEYEISWIRRQIHAEVVRERFEISRIIEQNPIVETSPDWVRQYAHASAKHVRQLARYRHYAHRFGDLWKEVSTRPDARRLFKKGTRELRARLSPGRRDAARTWDSTRVPSEGRPPRQNTSA